jgi:hypothetical protein
LFSFPPFSLWKKKPCHLNKLKRPGEGFSPKAGAAELNEAILTIKKQSISKLDSAMFYRQEKTIDEYKVKSYKFVVFFAIVCRVEKQ